MAFNLASVLRRRASYYHGAFDTPDGKWVLRDLMITYYAMATPAAVSSEDLAFKTGQRDVILHILKQVGIAQNPELFLKEAANARRDRDELDQYRDPSVSNDGR